MTERTETVQTEKVTGSFFSKTTVMMVLAQILAAAAVIGVVWYIYHSGPLGDSSGNLKQTLEEAVSKIDAGQVADYIRSGPQEPGYGKLSDYLTDVKQSNHIDSLLLLAEQNGEYQYIAGDKKTRQNGLYYAAMRPGEEFISAAAPVKDFNGRVVAVLYADQASADVLRTGIPVTPSIWIPLAAAWAAVVTLTGIGWALYIRRTVTMPMRKAAEAAQAVLLQEEPERLSEALCARQDEFGALFRGYDRLGQRIQALTTEMNVYKESVEQAVFYKAIVDTIHFPVAAILEDKKIRYVNQAASAFLQMEQDGIAGSPCSILDSPFCDVKDCTICQMQEGEKQLVETPPFTIHGRFYKMWAYRVYDPSGAFLCYLETVKDVTGDVQVDIYRQDGMNKVAEALSHLAKGNLKTRMEEPAVHEEWDLESIREVQKVFDAIREDINLMADVIYLYITDMADKLTAAACGDLAQQVTLPYEGDFEQVKNSLNTITATFHKMISDIDIAADQVSYASRSVSSGSQALAEATMRQLTSAQEISETMEVVAERARENAANARKVNQLVENAKASSLEGAGKMTEMAKAINEINQASGNISRINKTIEDIAFQTNILALNAAVEAAHAGQYGKGFAVVASEVRNLASKCTNAVQDTADLIESTIKKTGKGVVIANEAAEVFEKILESIVETAGSISGISEATGEQAVSVGQIAQSLDQILMASQGNSSIAEQTAAASEEMYTQADHLKNSVKLFKLKDRADRIEDIEDIRETGLGRV